MSAVVHSLASGSSGNCILVRDGRTAVLIDAGIGIRRIVASLRQAQVHPADLAAILITHEHSDHISGAVRLARRYGVLLVANAPTLAAIPGTDAVPTRVLDLGAEADFSGIYARSFPISHDAVCPVGYTVYSSGATICIATDTGYVTPDVRAEAGWADLLILESNHDLEMLRTGPYPWHLKRRIAGETGHLSNDAASALLLNLADRGRNMAVWLAHLSQTNNSPAIARARAEHSLYACLGTPMDLDVALRDVPSLVWRQSDRSFQLSLFDPHSMRD